MLDLVGNPKGRFSHDPAQIIQASLKFHWLATYFVGLILQWLVYHYFYLLLCLHFVEDELYLEWQLFSFYIKR